MELVILSYGLGYCLCLLQNDRHFGNRLPVKDDNSNSDTDISKKCKMYIGLKTCPLHYPAKAGKWETASS